MGTHDHRVRRARSRTFTGGDLRSRLTASTGRQRDWPWGRRGPQHGVEHEGLPTEWDVKTKKNVKWVADLGSQAMATPVVAGGMVFVGTNNEAPRDPAARRPRRADGVP
jgi:hypothetical protein